MICFYLLSKMSTGKGAKGNPSVTMNDVNAAIEKSEERQRKMLNEGIASVKERVDEKFQESKDMMELFMESVEKKKKVQRVEFQKEEGGVNKKKTTMMFLLPQELIPNGNLKLLQDLILVLMVLREN